MKGFSDFLSTERVFPFCICFFIFISLWCDFSVNYFLLDTLEHIRASMAVSSGLIPYVDFFEHHHPLLWYLLAPLAKMMYLNTAAIPLFRIIGTLAYLGCIYLAYQITKNLYGKQVSQFSVLCLLSIPTLWMDISNLRPDSFMLLFFLAGLKFILDYSDSKKIRFLILSYLSVSTSFLFLQKAAFFVVPFGIFNLYALFKKEIKLNDFILACVVGASPVVFALSILLYQGILTDFIYYNYTFNTQLQEYYSNYISAVPMLLRWLTVVVFLIIIRTYQFSFKTGVVFLCFLFSGISLIYFAPHSWYYIPYFVFAAILLGNYAYIANHKFVITGLLFAFSCSIISLYPNDTTIQYYKKYMKKIEYIVQQNIYNNTLDFSIAPINVFGPIKNFYWFGFHNVVIIDTIYNPNRIFNPNDVIKKTMPEYLILETSLGAISPQNTIAKQKASWFQNHNAKIIQKMKYYPELRSRLVPIDFDFWQFDEDWIKKNYTQIDNTNLYRRNLERSK